MLEDGRIKGKTKYIIAGSSYYPRVEGTKGRSCCYQNLETQEGSMDLELRPLRSECCCLLQVYNKPGSVYAENLNAGTNYG